ncbi:MAG TPA: T9SS type A sorting domain-containing protein, partial [Hanamia sp.]|nr:T9SS type A sorting domain-containing protein [Hanamia sp.]
EYQLSITQFNFWRERSATGPTNWSMTINGISVGSGSIPGSGSDLGNTGVLNPVQNLTGTITVQISLTGATDSRGTVKLDDFTLIGSVSPILTYYRSRQSGNWSTASIWEYSYDNSNWSVSSKSPTTDAENILIQSGHTVSVSTPVPLDQTTIDGTLQLQTGGELIINDGNGDDVTIESGGVLEVISENDYSIAVQQAPTANINIASGGKIKIGDGTASTGDGYEAFATSTTNVWNDGAIYEYDLDKAFAAPGLTYFPYADGNTIPIFRISAVSGTPGSGSSSDFHVNGILELNTDLNFKGTGDKYLRDGIRGDYSISQENAGQICLNGLHPVLKGDSLKINLSGNLKLYTDAEIPSGSYVKVSNSFLSNNVIDGTVLTINGTLDVTDQGIRNTNGSIILNGVFRTSRSGGFSSTGGSIPSGGITVNSGSTIELYADGDQNLNARDDFSNLIFSGSGTKKPTGSFSPLGTVTIKDDAIFDCRGKNIGDESESGPTATNLTMSDNSRLIVDTYGPNPKMAGTYNLTGGIIEFNGSNGTTETIRSKNYQNIEVTGTNVGISWGNINLNAKGTFTVKNGGVFSMNDNTIKGEEGIQTVTVESGGYFKCGNNQGFNGAAITSAPIQSSALNEDIENIVLEPNSTIEYTRDGDQPITNTGGLIYQNLVLSGSGNKTAPSDDLIIQGDLSKTSDAIFIHNNGTVIFNGSAIQNYLAASPQMTFYDLKNENVSGLNIDDSLSVYDQLSLEDYSATNLNADLTLLSDKDQTASIARLSTNAIINYYEGRFIVERYINTNSTDDGHQKSWELLSTPAFGQTIYDSWQEGGSKTITGYGTWITAPEGVAKGFDASSYAPSMKYYDADSDAWIGVSSTNLELNNEKGYMIFVRGDRQANTVNAAPTPTILRIRGKLYSPINLPPTSTVPAGKFQSIGNPYASAIDFEKINHSNIQSSYYAWDPALGGSYGYGGYQTISKATGYLAVPGATSNYPSTGNYQYIQSGQAFFVTNYTSSEGSVGFTEDCKVAGNYHLVTRETENEISILFANLVSQTGMLLDGTAVSFSKDFSDKIDGDDVKKIEIPAENFAIKNSEKLFVVEARNSIHPGDTLIYFLKNLKKQDYKLVFSPKKINTGLEAWLVDNFLKTEKSISLTDTSYINFSVTEDKGSSDAERFYLVFRAAEGPLPVTLISMNGKFKDQNVIIEWQVQNETENVKEYELAYSNDGIQFSKIGVVAAGNPSGMYRFISDQTKWGSGFYRLTGRSLNDEIQFEKVIKINLPEIKRGISIYPNPVVNNQINLQIEGQEIGKYYFILFNMAGQTVFSKQVNYTGERILNLKMERNLSDGIYQLEIINPAGERAHLKLKMNK